MTPYWLFIFAACIGSRCRHNNLYAPAGSFYITPVVLIIIADMLRFGYNALRSLGSLLATFAYFAAARGWRHLLPPARFLPHTRRQHTHCPYRACAFSNDTFPRCFAWLQFFHGSLYFLLVHGFLPNNAGCLWLPVRLVITGALKLAVLIQVLELPPRHRIALPTGWFRHHLYTAALRALYLPAACAGIHIPTNCLYRPYTAYRAYVYLSFSYYRHTIPDRRTEKVLLLPPWFLYRSAAVRAVVRSLPFDSSPMPSRPYYMPHYLRASGSAAFLLRYYVPCAFLPAGFAAICRTVCTSTLYRLYLLPSLYSATIC